MHSDIDTALDDGYNADSESYDYGCPPNASMANCSNSSQAYNEYYIDLAVTSLVYGFTLILGLIGNLLIIYTVARFQRMRSISNIFLASLATADLLIVTICIPVKYGMFLSFTWTLGEVACKLIHYIQNVSMISSVLNLTFLSIERYYAVIHPVRSRYLCTFSQARRVIIFIWLASFMMALPIVFIYFLERVGEGDQIAYWCIKDFSNVTYWRAYEIYMFILILCIPSVVMGYTYIRICIQLWIVIKERACMTTGTMVCTELKEKNSCNGDTQRQKNPGSTRTDEDTVKQVIKMLLFVVVLFIVCWAPILINNLLASFDVVNPLNYNHLKSMRKAFNLMAYFNSCINPIVYGFMSKNFRSSFREVFLSCLRPQHPFHGRTLSRTGTTSVSVGRSTYVT